MPTTGQAKSSRDASEDDELVDARSLGSPDARRPSAPVRPARRRRRHPRPRRRPGAARPPAGREPLRAGARARARRAPDLALERGDPRRHLLRAGIAEGAALRRGRPRPLRLLRGARDRGPPGRQADRRRRARRSCRGSTSSSDAGPPTRSPGCAASAATRSPRSSRTPAGSPRSTPRRPGWSTSARWRARTRPTSRLRAAP